MPELSEMHCEPCRGGIPPLDADGVAELKPQLGEDWEVVDLHHLSRTFTFPDFKQALELVNRIGAIAEAEGHHPNLYLTWGEVRVEIWTHKVDGLTLWDFVLAAKIDEIAD